MKKYFFLHLFLVTFTLFSQTSHETYEEKWQKVYSYELKSLPKSANTEVEKIYLLAKNENNSSQIIKSLIYKSKFSLILEENELHMMQQLKNEIETSTSPTKNILENILANIYYQYLKKERWKIYHRTRTIQKANSGDFRTWDLQTLFTEIQIHYNNSLKNESITKKIKLSDYDAILKIEEGSKKYRPTLFDFLAHNALSFFKTNEHLLSKPSYQFELDNETYFTQFPNINLNHKDSTSQKLKALEVYKNLALFHQKDKNPTAYVTLTIEAIKYIDANNTEKNNTTLLLETYKNLRSRVRHHAISTQLDFEIAKIARNKANSYTPKNNNAYRFENQEALSICETAMKMFPKSEGAKNCKTLKENIVSSQISITTEKNIPSEKFSRVLIDYKNIEQLYFNIYELPFDDIKKFNTSQTDSARSNFLKNLELIDNWTSTLRNENDYQKHKTEIIIPELPTGNYIILASNQKTNNNKNFINAYTHIQVTNLALIQYNRSDKHIYQIVDRNTGAPIEKVKVKLFANENTTNSHYRPVDKTFRTDKNGQFSYKSENAHRNVVAIVTTKNETAQFGDFYINKNTKRRDQYDEDDEIIIKPFLFTDRSIYRPGQKVHFKGIFLKKTGKTTKLFTDEFIEIIIENPNGDDVKTMELKLNEYGSFSGTFDIPNNGLTGEYSFHFDESYEHDSKFYDEEDFDFDYGYNSISVEEYKRPKFKTEFKPVKKTFKLNDSIIATGNATAFSGSKISDADVSYRVVRTANFPSWFRYYNRPTSSSLEICHGETTTDAEGNYEIIFKAIPDQKISKESQPTFNYAVSAEVTDINGETHQTETIIKVGYHALKINLNIADKIEKTESNNSFSLDAKNLNGQEIDTKGTIEIHKIKTSKKPLKERIWKAPDYQEITKEKFEQSFPHEPYVKFSEEKGKLVFKKNIDTKTNKKIELTNTKNWTSGQYIATVLCKDRFGKTVKTEKSFLVYATDDTKVSDNKLLTIQTDKNTYSPKENVILKIGSASTDMTVNIEVEKNHKIVSNHFVQLNNQIQSISIPVTEKDRGGFVIKYNTVNYNEFTNGSLFVNVPHETNHLNIETLSFRDKLQPGATQTWSFKIKGDKKQKVEAEVLASMYDVSLDEFKKHDWSFNPITRQRNYSYNNSSSAFNSFGTKKFNIDNKANTYSYYSQPNYDQIQWFGFNLNNSVRANRKYLNNITSQRKEFDGTLSGTITDDEGSPLPFASITIANTAYAAVTDFDGNYSLKIKKNDIVVISFVGFKSVTKTIKNTSILNIELIPDQSSCLDEVVVVGYGTQRKSELTGAVSTVLAGKVPGIDIGYTNGDSNNVVIRGISSVSANGKAIYVVDGVIFENDPSLSLNDIESIDVLKDAAATSIYGSRGANGVVVINTKSGQKKIEDELNQVKARTNLNETAFFYPNLRTDKKGNISFEFTMPEALTKWKLQLLAYSKDLHIGKKTLSTITQKELMVTPNAPRFLREGDSIILSSKIASLTEKELNGYALLQLTDAITGKDINVALQNNNKTKNFNIAPKGNTEVSWKLYIPEDIQSVQYKIVAKAGDFSDGEQNVLPVLSNRMLVTESVSLWVNANESKTFSLDKLKNNKSTSLKNHKLTLEITSNPAWYALQALPYLMEYPYECAEQTFSRYFANTMANHVVNANPKIKTVFEKWNSSDALVSNLEKNKELKSILIEETPWLRDLQSEKEQKKRIALLFDLEKLNKQQSNTFDKLEQMQMSNGGFPWFKGSKYANRNITQHIVEGFGHLNNLGIEKTSKKQKKLIKKALGYLDSEIEKDYQKIISRAKEIRESKKSIDKGFIAEKEFLSKQHISSVQLHYLYTRAFFKNYPIHEKHLAAVSYYKNQSATYWQEFSLYNKGLTALIFLEKQKQLSLDILKSLKENSISNEELGRYWKENKSSWFWYQSPIETQSLLIEAFATIENDTETVDELKKWLLKNKQTNRWKTTKATTEAIYALLLQGSDWLSVTENVAIKIGGKDIATEKLESTKAEAGTGYIKTTWNSDEITSDMATVQISKKNNGMAWGALYWQYFEDLDKITTAKTKIQVRKKLFIKSNGDTGKELSEITETSSVKLGDLITVRIEINSDRDMEFIHLKDMRASGVEPISVISEYKYQDGLGYYQSTKDASTNFFFNRIPKGTYIFEYDVRANNTGNFSNGITTLENMYAPEFRSHSEGTKLIIK